MKQPKDTNDEQRIANDISSTLPAARSLVDRMTALQEAADKIGSVEQQPCLVWRGNGRRMVPHERDISYQRG